MSNEMTVPAGLSKLTLDLPTIDFVAKAPVQNRPPRMQFARDEEKIKVTQGSRGVYYAAEDVKMSFMKVTDNLTSYQGGSYSYDEKGDESLQSVMLIETPDGLALVTCLLRKAQCKLFYAFETAMKKLNDLLTENNRGDLVGVTYLLLSVTCSLKTKKSANGSYLIITNVDMVNSTEDEMKDRISFLHECKYSVEETMASLDSYLKV